MSAAQGAEACKQFQVQRRLSPRVFWTALSRIDVLCILSLLLFSFSQQRRSFRFSLSSGGSTSEQVPEQVPEEVPEQAPTGLKGSKL